MKSKFLQLFKNDYLKAVYEATLGGVVGYVLPLLDGAELFNIESAKTALIGAVILGVRKGLTLWLTNSKGEFGKRDVVPPPPKK